MNRFAVVAAACLAATAPSAAFASANCTANPKAEWMSEVEQEFDTLAGFILHQLERIPSVQRQLGDALLVNEVRQPSFFGIDERRLSLNLNGLGDLTDFEREVEGDLLAGRNANSLPLDFLKPGVLHLDVVVARKEKRNAVIPLRIRPGGG